MAAAWLAVRSGIAVKPDAYSWRQLCGAGALGGIGFTMSLFIAGEAFPDQAVYAAAKIAIFLASLSAGGLGVLILWPRSEAIDYARKNACCSLNGARASRLSRWSLSARDGLAGQRRFFIPRYYGLHDVEIADRLRPLSDPRFVIIDESETWSADCIFVGAKGRNRIQRVRRGVRAEQAVRSKLFAVRFFHSADNPGIIAGAAHGSNFHRKRPAT